MKSYALTRTMISVATAAATIAAMGAPATLGFFDNKLANVFATSSTTVVSTNTSVVGNSSTTTQLGGGLFNNQFATNNSTAVGGVSSTINASSGNFVSVQ